MGQQLKIRRPRDYQPISVNYEMAARLPVSNIVVDSPNKIFIGGLPHYLNEDQVRQCCPAFLEEPKYGVLFLNILAFWIFFWNFEVLMKNNYDEERFRLDFVKVIKFHFWNSKNR